MKRFPNKLNVLRRTLLPAAVAVCFALFQYGTALAEKYADQAPPVQTKSYVYQYLLVGLCVALGVFLLGQPSKRTESVEKKDALAYEE